MNTRPHTGPPEETLLDGISPFIQPIALLGIPGAGCVALALFQQIPRLIYGQPQVIFLAAELASLLTVLILVIALRASLASSPGPAGIFRDLLDFLAMANWHPSLKIALVALIVLPQVWFMHIDRYLMFTMLGQMGARALQSGDFQTKLDTVAMIWQDALMGGVPLLFTMHMLTRWKPKKTLLPWLLVPVFIVGAAIAIFLIVMIAHLG
jgi:hypothetical protein